METQIAMLELRGEGKGWWGKGVMMVSTLLPSLSSPPITQDRSRTGLVGGQQREKFTVLLFNGNRCPLARVIYTGDSFLTQVR